MRLHAKIVQIKFGYVNFVLRCGRKHTIMVPVLSRYMLKHIICSAIMLTCLNVYAYDTELAVEGEAGDMGEDGENDAGSV
jgi:hypothetical protein